MKNAYDLAFQVQSLAAESRDPVLRIKALELADAVRREKDCGYHPEGWGYTGFYGLCDKCGDFLRGCGVPVGIEGRAHCPDCAK